MVTLSPGRTLSAASCNDMMAEERSLREIGMAPRTASSHEKNGSANNSFLPSIKEKFVFTAGSTKASMVLAWLKQVTERRVFISATPSAERSSCSSTPSAEMRRMRPQTVRLKRRAAGVYRSSPTCLKPLSSRKGAGNTRAVTQKMSQAPSSRDASSSQHSSFMLERCACVRLPMLVRSSVSSDSRRAESVRKASSRTGAAVPSPPSLSPAATRSKSARKSSRSSSTTA
mmetsp:Transcript_7633/g.12863  ORF Transcript_7633/g.12863 Transcript_7633/m.12863 type:complete len:229 (+) Transcript_7633:684-1370(+)